MYYVWIYIWALLNEKYHAHRIIKIHIFFLLLLISWIGTLSN